MTLPIANGLAGSAGHALPEDTVCDWNAGVQKPWTAEACHIRVLWIQCWLGQSCPAPFGQFRRAG
ncbi:hypothetical protein EVC37_12425 [Methylocaldum sp. BRCS4]|nr:hypothetical protein [Methylocaldum sp. BRCS4]